MKLLDSKVQHRQTLLWTSRGSLGPGDLSGDLPEKRIPWLCSCLTPSCEDGRWTRPTCPLFSSAVPLFQFLKEQMLTNHQHRSLSRKLLCVHDTLVPPHSGQFPEHYYLCIHQWDSICRCLHMHGPNWTWLYWFTCGAGASFLWQLSNRGRCFLLPLSNWETAHLTGVLHCRIKNSK